MLNNVVLIGRLTKDPELRYTTSGAAVTRFTLAVDKQLSNEKRSEFEAKGQPTADFIRIVAWGRQAENCANYLAKGRLVAVHGRIETGSYQDKDGKMVYTTDVVSNQVQFLEWGDENQQNGGNQQGGYQQGGYQQGGNQQGGNQQGGNQQGGNQQGGNQQPVGNQSIGNQQSNTVDYSEFFQ